MSHEIYENRLILREKGGWHGLGIIKEGDFDTIQALEEANMDFQVLKVPVPVIFDGVKVAEEYALVRERVGDEDPVFFGFVSKDYEVIQNRELAEALLPLSMVYPVESAGSLSEGRTTFFSLRAETVDINGDEVVNYFMASEEKTGKGGLNIVVSPIRTVCKNTLRLAMDQAKVNIPITHKTGAKEDLKFWARYLPKLKEAQEEATQVMQKMADTTLVDRQVQEILEKVYAPPPGRSKAKLKGLKTLEELHTEESLNLIEKASNSDQYYRDRQLKFRLNVKNLLDVMNDEFPRNANSAWNVLNAIVEFEDYRKTTNKESVAESKFFGERARIKDKASKIVMQVAGI